MPPRFYSCLFSRSCTSCSTDTVVFHGYLVTVIRTIYIKFKANTGFIHNYSIRKWNVTNCQLLRNKIRRKLCTYTNFLCMNYQNILLFMYKIQLQLRSQHQITGQTINIQHVVNNNLDT